ncbi:DUF4365 domain-containing protein [Desulfovibrio aminophilus]|uniref:DUF4365 domain-containing protein n=1 Tax=Desulfovibrio aminophilus TaxID=81425 RepID=UPI00339375D4
MNTTNQPQTERLGVAAAQTYFAQHGWLFREQPIHDFGIDAQVEIVDRNQPTGKLIALQIKSGVSYFRNKSDKGFSFIIADTHLKYWLNHSLPVLIILYNPENETLYWENVCKENIIEPSSATKIIVSKVLNDSAIVEIKKIIKVSPYVQKFNRLILDKFWINLIADGEEVYIEFDDWVNKSLPRYQITIGCNSRKEIATQSWPMIYGIGEMHSAISYVLPWADFNKDEDAHINYMEEKYGNECFAHYDKEDDKAYYTEPFDQWLERQEEPDQLTLCGDTGETMTYRSILSLNDLGKSFLVLDQYLNSTDFLLDESE